MKRHLLASLLMMYGFSANAQISIDFPKERQVFQRTGFDHSTNFKGDGIIRISGNFTAEYDSIQAKVEPRVAGQGVATSWIKVNDRNSKPYYKGSISAKGGWYILYVKAFKNGLEIDIDTIQRVGIGEVFIIAGQSNAQGGKVPGLPANDDRVNAVNYDNDSTIYNKLPIGFTQIDDDSSSLGPFHFVPWAWGRLGDKLADSLNVPILFYGAAHGGTPIEWWKKAANGENIEYCISGCGTEGNAPCVPNCAPGWLRVDLGAPYKALEMSLNFYSSLTGVRGVLWHQGESDRDGASNISGVDYKAHLESIIAESRVDSECDTLSWMIARATVSGSNSVDVDLQVNGQTATAQADNNVFLGPITDNLLGYSYRTDLTHFDTNLGQTSFADLWFNIMVNNSNEYFQNSSAIPSADFIDLDFICNPGNPSNPITLTSSITYDKYAWSNRNNTDSEAKGYSHDGCCEYINYPPEGYQRLNWQYDSTSSVTASPGKYALNVRKALSEKVLFSPVLDLNTFTLPTNPTFTSSALQIRPGDTLTLTGSTCNDTYLWSTMTTGSPYELYPTGTDNYTVSCKTLHCLSSASASTQVVVSSCFADPLNLTAAIYGTESPYQSQQIITSTQLLSSRGKIDYTANQSITLSPGFLANSGAVFQATIGNCP